MFKKSRVILYLLITLTAVLLPMQRVLAFQPDTMVQKDFPTLDSSSVKLMQPVKSGDITASFVNRNTLKVTFSGTPLPSDSGNTYQKIFGGNYLDSDSDPTWEYRRDGSPTSGYALNFDDSGKVNSDVDSPFHLGQANTANIKSIRFFVGYIVTGSRSTDIQLLYLNKNYQWKQVATVDGPTDTLGSPRWRSDSSQAFEALMTKITDSGDMPSVKLDQPDNFNIIGQFNPSDQTITSFETSDTHVFHYCNGATEQTFRLKGCDNNGDDYLVYSGSIDDVTKSSGLVPMKFAKAGSTVQIAGGNNNSVNPAGSGTDVSSTNTCESQVASAFAWALCPLLDGIDKFSNKAETFIQDNLEIDIQPSARDGLHQIWTQMARISSSILLLASLIMVISTALGFGVFEAYTIKKLLPRILIATVMIWLSWPIIFSYISLINDFGRGIGQLMLGTFGAPDTFHLGNIIGTAAANAKAGTEGLFVAAITTGAVASVLTAGGPFAILSMALTAFAGFLIAFVTLAVRKMLILLLIVTAPLGIAAWIFPTMQTTWKLWSGTLNKLLIMYPLVSMLFASGKILAYIIVTAKQGQNTGIFDLFMALVAYLIPLFLLPAAFKATAGILGKLTGMVNDRGKGIFDKARNSLDAKTKARKAYKDQLGKEHTLKSAAGAGKISSRYKPFGAISRARLRAQAGQPTFGGVLPGTRNRVGSSMAATMDKLEDQLVAEETNKMGREGNLMTDGGALSKIAFDEGQSIYRRRAAVNRLLALGDEQFALDMNQAATTGRYASGAAVSDSTKGMWTSAKTSKDYNDAFKEKAPDLTSRGVGAFAKGLTPEEVTNASDKALRRMRDHLVRTQSELSAALGGGMTSLSQLTADQQSTFKSFFKDDLGNDITDIGQALANAQRSAVVTAKSFEQAATLPGLKGKYKLAGAVASHEFANDAGIGSMLTASLGSAGAAARLVADVNSRIDPTRGVI